MKIVGTREDFNDPCKIIQFAMQDEIKRSWRKKVKIRLSNIHVTLQQTYKNAGG